MNNHDYEINQIMDDIASGLMDDPVEDYKYLCGELGKYETHELAEEIRQEIAKILFGELPVTARNELTSSHDAASFDFMLDQAEHFVFSQQWGPAEMILRNLIGKGISINDTDKVEFRSFDEKQKVQAAFYEKFFKSGKKVVQCPADFGRLYGLFGVVLVEHKEISAAQEVLALSIHYNPLDYRFFFEYAETFKLSGDLEKLEQLSREYLKYAYRAAYIGHLYRNLGYVYTEKKDYETAIALYQFALAYDSEHSEVSEQELAYISHITRQEIKDLSQEEAEAPLKRADIQIGASYDVQYQLAVRAQYFSEDEETADYYCDLLYDVTRDDEFVNEVRSKAHKPQVTVNTGSNPWDSIHPYEDARDAALKKVFPDYPEVNECRLNIEFTVGSTKYAETIDLILEKIDDLCKAVDGKHVALYFSSIDSIKENTRYINDIIVIAGGWKSFEISINGGIIAQNIFTNYFMDFLGMRYSAASPDDIRKAYKKAATPPRPKKERPEDAIRYSDLDKLTPKELLHGIIHTYAEVYLKDHTVQTYNVTDKEIVLVADDDLIVDFWMANQTRESMGSGYHSWEYVIQELTPNNIFRYNHSAFHQIFWDAHISLTFVKYQYPKLGDGPLNHFQKINSTLPALKLKERCNNVPIDPYSFVIVQMANADGSVGYGIGYTAKDARSLLLKICKNLEAANPYGLDKRGIPGLDIQNSVPFFKAFQSWKGGKKTERLQNYLKYHVIEKEIKADYEIRPAMDEIMRGIKTGQYDDASWKTYADIGRRSKK